MPGYKGKEYYAPEKNDEVKTLDKRFLGLTDVQIGFFALPTVVVITVALLILLNKKVRKSPSAYISLALAIVHLYHHYTLVRLQNKH